MVIMKNAKSKAIKNPSIVRQWYTDATFTVVGKPFYQLWTIIGHIRRSTTSAGRKSCIEFIVCDNVRQNSRPLL